LRINQFLNKKSPAKIGGSVFELLSMVKESSKLENLEELKDILFPEAVGLSDGGGAYGSAVLVSFHGRFFFRCCCTVGQLSARFIPNSSTVP
jgi:hypothetical protein